MVNARRVRIAANIQDMFVRMARDERAQLLDEVTVSRDGVALIRLEEALERIRLRGNHDKLDLGLKWAW